MTMKHFKIPFFLVTVILVLAFPFGFGSAQEESLLYSQNFESGWPEEWEAEMGWEITETEWGSSLIGAGHNWSFLNTGRWEDYRFRFDVKLDSNALVHANFRLSEGPNRYYIGISQKNIYLAKQTGPDQFFDLTDTQGIGEGWHTIEIAGYGSEIFVYVDDREVLTFHDPEPLRKGGVAFESIMDGPVWIDNVQIWGTEETSATENDETALGSSDLTWVRLGGPPGGLGYDIRYNYNDPNTWYVTDANAGVHISTDNGSTWHQSNQGIDTVGGPAGDGIPVFSLTVDPHDPKIIWIGTDLTGDIYKSIDGGLTWKKKSQGILQEIEIVMSFRGFTVDPRTSDIVYAMGELQKSGNNVWGLNVGGVIYKTVDGGEHWKLIWDGEIPSSLARYMWINPEDPDVMYFSTGIFDRGAVGETDPDTDPTPWGGLGVLKSTDSGLTWRALGYENGLDFLYIGSLFMHPENPDILFAAAGHVVPELALQQMMAEKHSPLGIYRTVDGGESWHQVLEPEGDLLVQTFSSVDICPGNSSVIYAGSDVAIYRSDDGGDSWVLMTGKSGTWGPPGVRAGWPIDLQCDPRDPYRVFANNYSGGNFLSEDGGRTWVNASNGYSGAQIIGVAVDPFNASRIFAVGRSGAWYSTDAGANWSGIHNPGETKPLAGGEWGGVAFDPVNRDHVLLGSEVFLNWNALENRWISTDHQGDYGPEISEIEFAPSDPSFVYAVSANHNSMIHAYNYESGRGIILSKDGGYSWQSITGEQFDNAVLTDVSVDPFDPGVAYAAAQTGLYKSSDYGENWAELVIESPGDPVRTVAVHLADPNRVYAGLPGKGVFLSDDGGESWRQVFAGLEPNGDYRDIIFDPANPDIVYLSDIVSGIYQSTDRGETWLKLINGLSNRAATSLSISSDGMHLYAGTAGGGVFRLDLNSIPPETYDPQSPPSEAQDDSQPLPDREQEEPSDEDSKMDETVSEEDPGSQPRWLFIFGGSALFLVASLIFYYFRRK